MANNITSVQELNFSYLGVLHRSNQFIWNWWSTEILQYHQFLWHLQNPPEISARVWFGWICQNGRIWDLPDLESGTFLLGNISVWHS